MSFQLTFDVDHIAAVASQALVALRTADRPREALALWGTLDSAWPDPYEPARHALNAWLHLREGRSIDAALAFSTALQGGFSAPGLASAIAGAVQKESPSEQDRVDLAALEQHGRAPSRDQLTRAGDAHDADGSVDPALLLNILRVSPLTGDAANVDPAELLAWLYANSSDAGNAAQAIESESLMLAATAREQLDEVLGEIDQNVARAKEALGRLSSTVQQAATGNLIKAYASRAEAARKRAGQWTAATVVVTVIAVVLAFVLLLIEPDELTTGQAVARVGLTLSVLTLAGFAGRMASHERRDVRSWTHMDLQLSTAQGFIQDLPHGHRSEAQLALALRFFPGQAQDPHGDAGASSDGLDVSELLRLARTAGGNKPASQG